jgi:hypothetical protein
MSADLEDRFSYHPPRDSVETEKYKRIREMAKDFAYQVLDLAPEGREQALALTKIEETVFWANAAIARKQPRK